MLFSTISFACYLKACTVSKIQKIEYLDFGEILSLCRMKIFSFLYFFLLLLNLFFFNECFEYNFALPPVIF